MWYSYLFFVKRQVQPPALQWGFDNQSFPFVIWSQSTSLTARHSAPSEQMPVSRSPLCLNTEATDAKQERAMAVNVVCVAAVGRGAD